MREGRQHLATGARQGASGAPCLELMFPQVIARGIVPRVARRRARVPRPRPHRLTLTLTLTLWLAQQ